MIAITGATGQLGAAVVTSLLQQGVAASQIVALVRDEAKAGLLKQQGVQIRIGDYNNYASLIAAFGGVEKLLLVSGNDVQNREKQQLDAVKAAKEAGVKHVVYTSFGRKNETATSPIAMVALSHVATENALKASGLSYTILQNNLYTDVLPMFLGPNVLETGVFFPTESGKAAFTTRQDMAEATAYILRTSGHENQTYVFAGTTNYSLADVAAALGKIAGKNVPNVNPSAEVYSQALTAAGLPEHIVGFSLAFAQAIAQGEFETNEGQIEQFLGRPATTLEAYLQSVYGA